MNQTVWITRWSIKCASRRLFRTLVKILVPPLVLLVLVVLRATMTSSTGCDETAQNTSYCTYNEFYVHDITKLIKLRNETEIHYTPPTFRNVMDQVALDLGVHTQGFSTEEEIEKMLKQNSTMYEMTLAAVIFAPVDYNQQTYSIRMKSWLSHWNTDRLYPLVPTATPRANSSYTGPPFYFQSGFLALQSSIDSHLSGFDLSQNVTLQKFPHPPYKKDTYLAVIPIVLPLLLLISYGLLASDLVREITEQKFVGMKEFLTLNRLTRSSYWLSWYMIALFLFTPTTLLNIAVLYSGSAIVYSDISLVCVYLLMFMFSSIALSLFFSCFVKNPMTSMMWSVVMWLILYAPFFFIEADFQNVSGGAKTFLCLVPPIALGMGCRLIGISEMTGDGVTWSNYTDTDMGISFQTVLAMLLFDTIMFTLLAVYIDAIFPGKYGYPKNWYFCLDVCSRKKVTVSSMSENAPLLCVQYSNRENYEKIPRTAKLSIDVKAAKKEYKDNKTVTVAVEQTDMKIVEGEITVIIGPNGSGKSTLLAMMAGFIKPTDGDITVAGISQHDGIWEAQDYISYMPQTGALVDVLTVLEHLVYYSTLRGLSMREVEVHCEETLHILGLTPLMDLRAGNLSGGQKRKLSLAIALVADSSILLLDEPMAGMDVENRSLVCSVLQRIKSSCTIVMCTHSVDEAAGIADRIGVMMNNKLYCYGSDTFIKSMFGIGYSMKLLKEANCQDSLISKGVIGAIPKSTVLTNNSTELVFSIPKDGISPLIGILKKLERDTEALGIREIIISENTLEEAYLQLLTGKRGEGLARKATGGYLAKQSPVVANRRQSSQHAATRKQSIQQAATRRQNSLKELQLTCNHEDRKPVPPPRFINKKLWAAIGKNFKVFKHHWFLTLAMIILPFIFCIFMFSVLRIGKQDDVTEPVLLWISTYAPCLVPFISDNVTLNESLNQVLASSGALPVDIRSPSSHKDNMDDYLLDKQNSIGFSDFRKDYIIGQEMYDNDEKMVGRYADVPLHSAPISLSVAHNTIIMQQGGNISVRTINKPLPLLDGEGKSGSSIALMTLYLLGVSFLVSLSVVIPASEIDSGVKHLQQFSGLKSHYFWLGVYLLTVLISLICSVLCTLTVLLTREPAFYEGGRWSLLWLVTFLFFLSGLPLSFIIAVICKKPTVSYALCELIHKGLGFVTVVLVGVFYLDDVDMKQVADVLRVFFLALPSFSAAQAMSNIYRNYNLEQRCMIGRCAEKPVNYLAFTQPGIGFNIISLVFCSGFYLAILLSYDYINRKRRGRFSKQTVIQLPLSTVMTEDEGVAAERDRMTAEGYNNGDTLVMRDLQKSYNMPDNIFVALQGLTIGVGQGETFGLLGSNGAGKSTTFRILTGADSDHIGNVYYSGINLRTNSSPPNVGYCPQFPALIPSLTVRHHMVLFARIKQQNEEYLVKDIVKIMKVMGLLDVADTVVENLSEGNKKKLGVSLAFIGVPEILLLDEPSTGLDEEGKRLLTQLLIKMRSKGTATLITSHNMLESEAICTRVGILTNGSLQCLGSLPELKARFGDYTVITLTLESCPQAELDSKMATLGAFISVNFPGSEIKELRDRRVTYALQQTTVRWSMLFEVLEDNLPKLGVEDYSVTKASLGQVYLSIVRAQQDDIAYIAKRGRISTTV